MILHSTHPQTMEAEARRRRAARHRALWDAMVAEGEFAVECQKTCWRLF